MVMASRASKAVHQIMKDWGHHILLQRRTPNDFETTLSLHTVRHMKPSNLLGLVQQEQVEGTTHDVDVIYFFLPSSKVKEGDRIYEYDERFKDFKNGPQTTWIVDYALPVRGVKGKTEFFAVGCTRESPN